MTTSPSLRAKRANVSRKINRFEDAVRAHEMMGSRLYIEREAIEHEYEQAKQLLRSALLKEPK